MNEPNLQTIVPVTPRILALRGAIAARHFTIEEVRSRWPRLQGVCPKGCGFSGLYYASFEHYLAGDW